MVAHGGRAVAQRRPSRAARPPPPRGARGRCPSPAARCRTSAGSARARPIRALEVGVVTGVLREDLRQVERRGRGCLGARSRPSICSRQDDSVDATHVRPRGLDRLDLPRSHARRELRQLHGEGPAEAAALVGRIGISTSSRPVTAPSRRRGPVPDARARAGGGRRRATSRAPGTWRRRPSTPSRSVRNSESS